MAARNKSRVGVLQWVIVLVVGVLVVAVVLGLNLIPRLNDGQKVLNGAKPAFAPGRVEGARAGIDFISHLVDLSDPIVTPQGGGAGEVPAVVAYVAKQQHVSNAQALALLQKNFPHTTALLQAIPLSAVSAEIPALVGFLTPAVIGSIPHLLPSVLHIQAVTDGWEHIPTIDGLTRFDGTPVQSVPQLRTYFSKDLVPVLEHQHTNYASLDGTSAVDWIAPLLLIIGIVVILFAALMIFRHYRGVARGEAMAGAAVVLVVGVAVTALVLVISLIPRVSNGQKLLDSLRPVNTQQRVQGDRTGINQVSTIVDTLNPIMTDAGGGASDVPGLLAFVAKQQHITTAQALALLQKDFPHTTALLQAIPLTAVSAEIPALVGFLTPAVVGAIPHLLPTVLNAQAVTSGWNNVPNTAGATRFNGTPVKTAPDVRTYFSSDVIPVLETQRANYSKLVQTSNIDFLGPLVLVVGVIVIIYGLLMLFLASRLPREGKAPAGARAPAAAQ